MNFPASILVSPRANPTVTHTEVAMSERSYREIIDYYTERGYDVLVLEDDHGND